MASRSTIKMITNHACVVAGITSGTKHFCVGVKIFRKLLWLDFSPIGGMHGMCFSLNSPGLSLLLGNNCFNSQIALNWSLASHIPGFELRLVFIFSGVQVVNIEMSACQSDLVSPHWKANCQYYFYKEQFTRCTAELLFNEPEHLLPRPMCKHSAVHRVDTF